MDNLSNISSNDRNDEYRKIEEYYQKENIFDPTKNSPNRFMKKLEYRMLRYYNFLYRSTKRNNKK